VAGATTLPPIETKFRFSGLTEAAAALKGLNAKVEAASKKAATSFQKVRDAATLAMEPVRKEWARNLAVAQAGFKALSATAQIGFKGIRTSVSLTAGSLKLAGSAATAAARGFRSLAGTTSSILGLGAAVKTIGGLTGLNDGLVGVLKRISLLGAAAAGGVSLLVRSTADFTDGQVRAAKAAGTTLEKFQKLSVISRLTGGDDQKLSQGLAHLGQQASQARQSEADARRNVAEEYVARRAKSAEDQAEAAQKAADEADEGYKQAVASGDLWAKHEASIRLDNAKDAADKAKATSDYINAAISRAEFLSKAQVNGPAQIFRALGVATADANGQLRDNADLMEEVIDRTQNLNRAQRQVIFGQLFGEEAARQMADFSDLLLSAGMNAQQFGEYYGTIVSPKRVEQARAFQFEIRRLKEAFLGLKLAIGSRFLESFSQDARKLSDLIARNREAIADWIFNGWMKLRSVIIDVYDIWVDRDREVKNTWILNASGALKGVRDALALTGVFVQELYATIRGDDGSVIEFPWLTDLRDRVVTTFQTIEQYVLGVIPGILAAVVDFGHKIVDVFTVIVRGPEALGQVRWMGEFGDFLIWARGLAIALYQTLSGQEVVGRFAFLNEWRDNFISFFEIIKEHLNDLSLAFDALGNFFNSFLGFLGTDIGAFVLYTSLLKLTGVFGLLVKLLGLAGEGMVLFASKAAKSNVAAAVEGAAARAAAAEAGGAAAGAAGTAAAAAGGGLLARAGGVIGGVGRFASAAGRFAWPVLVGSILTDLVTDAAIAWDKAVKDREFDEIAAKLKSDNDKAFAEHRARFGDLGMNDTSAPQDYYVPRASIDDFAPQVVFGGGADAAEVAAAGARIIKNLRPVQITIDGQDSTVYADEDGLDALYGSAAALARRTTGR
jgi:hypothetical protein